MLPRYLPHVAWRTWSDWLFTVSGRGVEARERFIAALGGGRLPPFSRAFESLRAGLFVWFSDLRRSHGSGAVLMSSQICMAVRHAVERAGLSIQYIDIDQAGPTPGAVQYAATLEASTIAVLVAPMYGHIQQDWNPLLKALGERALVLDLAQGIGLENHVSALVERADVVAYSFGLGKGLDTGGGLLLSRTDLQPEPLPVRSKLPFAVPFVKSAALRGLSATGLYGPAMLYFNGMDAVDAPMPRKIALAPTDVYALWLACLPRFLEEVALARTRAQALASMQALAADIQHASSCFSPHATHLRQLLRVRDASRRDPLISQLRRAGVDCAAAGEPLPQVDGQVFPNAAAFRAEAIRLPFLGRLTERQFRMLMTVLERAVVDALH